MDGRLLKNNIRKRDWAKFNLGGVEAQRENVPGLKPCVWRLGFMD